LLAANSSWPGFDDHELVACETLGNGCRDRRVDLSGDDMQQRAKADRPEVDPPIQVEAVT